VNKVLIGAAERIYKAKIRLQETCPFFAYLVMCMRVEEQAYCPTMAVDKDGNLWYNPGFVDTLSDDLLRSALCHEVLHVILDHLRRAHRTWDHELGNLAADIVANAFLAREHFPLDAGWVRPQDDTLDFHISFDPQKPPIVITDAVNKAVEEVYYLLEKHLPKSTRKMMVKMYAACPDCGGSGHKPDGSPCEKCGGSGTQGKPMAGRFDQHRAAAPQPKQRAGAGQDQDKDQGEAPKAGALGGVDPMDIWKFRVAEAVAYARQRGTVSGGIQGLVNAVVEPKADWRLQLSKYIVSRLPSNMTWNRPHKKSHSLGVYLPSFVREHLDVVVHIDSSGSIRDEELVEFLTEVCGILRSYSSVEATLLVCDCALQEVVDLTESSADSLLPFKVKGRGGTSHQPVVDWVNENRPQSRLLISMTDGCSDIPTAYATLPENCDSLFVVPSGATDKGIRAMLEEHGDAIFLDP